MHSGVRCVETEKGSVASHYRIDALTNGQRCGSDAGSESLPLFIIIYGVYL